MAAHKRGWIYSAAKVVTTEGVRIVGDAEKVAEGLAQIIPGAQTAEEKLQKEVEELTAKARQTELYHYAAIGLRAFGTGLQSLSADQRKALELWIGSKVPGVTPAEIDAALQYVENATSQAAGDPLITTANAFTQAQQAQQAQPQTTA
ncbi:hypothetical protein GCM10025857_68060 [Alicyclobacillus contaminans]|nr:hypothetical protein GCM10025857_68060 [Alicyclobacillus contaminans]